MLRFFSKPCIGIEITSRAARLGVLSGIDPSAEVLATATVPLAPAAVGEHFGQPNIHDPEGLASAIRAGFPHLSGLKNRRIGLSLADGIFRVQNLDFDELPAGRQERERLLRWRIEKGAAFDAADTMIRYQVFPRAGKGFSVLVCVAKTDVVAQYEDLVGRLGLEVWHIGPSSFNALNFYAPAATARNIENYAFAWITESSYSTIIMERGDLRFYRYREIKGGTGENSTGRIMRELDDSLHFYTHRDRLQSTEIVHLALAGDSLAVPALAEELKEGTTLDIEVLLPSAVLQRAGDAAGAMAPAFGAGGLR
jgi:Tfp pilus assembly PilM family ATPase